jgi:hypothetical protein
MFSHSVGSGLWLGHSLRRSFCAGASLGCAILKSVFNSIVSKAFIGSAINPILASEEHCYKEEECRNQRCT